jgi:transcriptional regulator with XRE-family HTH domain
MKKSVHTPEYAFLCSELRKLRTDAKLTQRELAARLNFPHSWVAKVETGERRIDFVEFCWFVSACGINPLRLAKKLVEVILAGSSTPPPGGQPQ